MAPSNVTHRLARSISYVVISSSPSGRMTLPLIDPATGELEHYVLVKTKSPSSTAITTPIKAEVRPYSSRRTLSENGALFSISPARRTKHEQRLAQLSERYLLDVSPDALRLVEEDGKCSYIARSQPSSPPCPKLKSSAFFRRFDVRSPAHHGTPSLVNETDISLLSSPSCSLTHTPSRRSRSPSTRATGSSEFPYANVSVSEGNESVLVGLGLSGVMNEDGSPFNGLGLLPRIDCSTPAEHRAHDAWTLFGDRRDLAHSAHSQDEDLDPEALFWRDATAADFRKRLDEEVQKCKQFPNRTQSPSRLLASYSFSTPLMGLRASGSFRMAQYREHVAARGNVHRHSVPCAPLRDGIFLSGSSYGGDNTVGTPTPTGLRRVSLGLSLRDVSRPASTSL
ncbi:uncharacterized protein FIBRA_07961 [Fibroporia radiculosa]|uniref:Uncharacterized protein n=1 Tax=Fibroporia radiculosa TaxID=599839 RepID=J4H4X1_9APHY|nr:uncharacterized protein FIBRA_07961 [Fibroporia radiculosa]CCM05729.1 predicted protein [Fibroporia radiculosa]